MIEQPLLTFLPLLITTYLANVISYFASKNAAEELKDLQKYTQPLETIILIAIFGIFLVLSNFSMLSLLFLATAILFYRITKNKAKAMYLMLPLILFSSTPNTTLLTSEAVLIFMYLFFTTTTFITKFVKKDKLTEKILGKVLLNNISFLIVGCILFIINL